MEKKYKSDLFKTVLIYFKDVVRQCSHYYQIEGTIIKFNESLDRLFDDEEYSRQEIQWFIVNIDNLSNKVKTLYLNQPPEIVEKLHMRIESLKSMCESVLESIEYTE